MFALVLGAVRARTAQVLTVLVLTVLAAAAAAAGPFFGLAAASRAAAADVSAAPAVQRTLSIRQQAGTSGDPRTSLDSFAATAAGILAVRTGAPVLGMRQTMAVARGGNEQAVAIGYRDGFCANAALVGTCPAAAGEIALSTRAAQQLGVQVGDDFAVRSTPSTEPVPLRIVATYQLGDPTGEYWSNPLFRSDGGLDPIFTEITTFENRQLWQPTLTYDVGVPIELLRSDSTAELGNQLTIAASRLNASSLQLVDLTPPLLATIQRDKAAIRLGVWVATGEVLVLGWLAIGLAGRYTGRDRRGDAALLKLRGSTRTGMLRLTIGQHLVPLLAGAVLGAPLGWLLALLLAGPVPGSIGPAVVQAALAVGAVVAGGLLALIAVEAAVLWQPVAVLLRTVAAGRRDWRSDVADAILVAVAVAAVYQARTGGSDNSLGLLAPALVAVAVALVLARLLLRIADRAGAVAVRRGRLGAGLTAVQASRQQGTDRVFALIVVAVAMFTTAAGGWTAGREARAERSSVELGAARVLTVGADNRTQLQYAVRQADPGGRAAMAAVVDRLSDPPVLAVDSSRLAAVANWRPEYGPLSTLPAAVAGVPLPAPLPAITGDRLTLRATNAQGEPITVIAVLVNEASGAAVPVALGPLRAGTHTVSARVTGCTGGPGCRLVRFEIAGPAVAGNQPGAPPPGAELTLRGLTQQNPAVEILGPAGLADIARWRSSINGLALDVRTGDGTLTVTVDEDRKPFAPLGNQVISVDAALPVPIVLAGPQPQTWQTTDAAVFSFGGGVKPVRVAGTASVLPVLGAAGMLVDLDTVRRVSGDADLGGTFQVWLSADAPASIVGALRSAGLRIISDDSVAERSAALAGQGSAVAVRFGLLCAAIALLLAAAAVAVAAAVDREPQARQLLSLRTQGLSRRAAVLVAYAGQAVLVSAGLLGGLAAAAVADPLARVSAPAFTDGWQVIAPPGALGGATLAAAGLIAALVLGLTCWTSARPLARRLRGGAR